MEDSRERIRLITIINKQLIKYDQLPLSPKDFDTLYDLEMNDLINAKFEIESQLEQLRRIKQFTTQ